MRKGKIREEKKYLSILFVPHFSGKVRTLKFSSFYKKIVIGFCLVLAALTGIASFILYTVNENNQLKNDIILLCNSNMEQKNLIIEKLEEFDELRTSKEVTNSKIDDFVIMYKEIADKYITGRIDNSKISRSGDREEITFTSDMSELRGILEYLNDNNNSDEDNLIDLSGTEKRLKTYIDSIPTLWPLDGRAGSKFGYRIHPIYKVWKFHEGIDIGAYTGTPIKAAASGTVTISGKLGGYGLCVMIDHGYGFKTVYGHASKLLVKVGQKVSKGEIIANVGSTGLSTEPHLHFEIRVHNNPVDPLNYLDKR